MAVGFPPLTAMALSHVEAAHAAVFVGLLLGERIEPAMLVAAAVVACVAGARRRPAR